MLHKNPPVRLRLHTTHKRLKWPSKYSYPTKKKDNIQSKEIQKKNIHLTEMLALFPNVKDRPRKIPSVSYAYKKR